MNNFRIRLRYINEGKEFDFPLDMERADHRLRANNMLLWAKAERVVVSIRLDDMVAQATQVQPAEPRFEPSGDLGQKLAATTGFSELVQSIQR